MLILWRKKDDKVSVGRYHGNNNRVPPPLANIEGSVFFYSSLQLKPGVHLHFKLLSGYVKDFHCVLSGEKR